MDTWRRVTTQSVVTRDTEGSTGTGINGDQVSTPPSELLMKDGCVEMHGRSRKCSGVLCDVLHCVKDPKTLLWNDRFSINGLNRFSSWDTFRLTSTRVQLLPKMFMGKSQDTPQLAAGFFTLLN